jgi:HAD superfamily hydrolase (TIGR01549 family)
MHSRKLSAIAFDLDNTLVSSNLDFDMIRHDLGCPKNIDLLSYIEKLPLSKQENAKKRLVDFEISDAKNTIKLPGVDELLAKLFSLNIPCAIITRNCRVAAQLKIDNNSIEIPLLLTREDHRAKPAPDALLYLCQYWQIPPEQLLYVGDYLYDIQTAENANSMSCLVTHGDNLPYAGLADFVVEDLKQITELMNSEFSLPILDEILL